MSTRLSKSMLALLAAIGLAHSAFAQSIESFIPPEAAIAVKCEPPKLIQHNALSDVPWQSLSAICRASLGFPLEDARSVLAFAAPPGPDGIPMIGAVVELREPIPIEKLAPRMQAMGALHLESLPQDQGQYLVGPAIGSTTWEVRLLKDKTILFGFTPTIEAMQKQAAKPVPSELTRRLSEHSDSAFQACVVMQPLRRLVKPIVADPRLVQRVPGIDQVPDQLTAATFQLDLTGNDPQMTLSFASANPTAAQEFQQFATHTWQQSLESLKVHSGETIAQFAQAFTQIKPTLNGSEVTFTTAGRDVVTRAMYVRGLTDLVRSATEEISFQTRRIAAMEDMKHLTLALHIFADQNKNHFPPQAITSPDGKPLLSWRVQLLPHLDQQQLYDQFHLNEPWDSPHNLALAKKIPEVYTIPGDEDLATEGKTRYQLPIGEGMPGEHLGSLYFSDITDGSSNTLFLVEAPREKAVVWTQPADLPVDINNPKAALLPPGSPGFCASRYDGSSQFRNATTSDATLKALLTHQGGEVVRDE